MFEVVIQQHFPHKLSRVFADFSDHQTFGSIIGAKISRVKDGDKPWINGLNSVRQIKSFPAQQFEETIVGFEPDALIEYRVTQGTPLKAHLGRMVFTEKEGGTWLDYRIQFLPKLAIPGWGWLLTKIIRAPLAKGIAAYARSEFDKDATPE